MKTRHSMLIAVFFSSASLLQAQNLFSNPGLEGPHELSVVPPGWQAVSLPSPILQATQPGYGDTPDTMGPGYFFSHAPHEGNSFVYGEYGPFNHMFYQEGIQQQVNLLEGESYEISFWQAVVKLNSIYTETTGGWQIYLNNTYLNNYSPTTSYLPTGTFDPGWEFRSFELIAPSDGTFTISFVPYGTGERVVGMGIDAVSLTRTSIPEPSTALIGSLGLLPLLRRKR